jgi:hypothetical protein
MKFNHSDDVKTSFFPSAIFVALRETELFFQNFLNYINFPKILDLFTQNLFKKP